MDFEVNSPKELFIEAILEDEGLTDGLPDDVGQIIIDWCLQQIEQLDYSLDKSELETQANAIRGAGKLACKIANLLQDGEEIKKIENRLKLLVKNAAQQREIIEQLTSLSSLESQVHKLLMEILPGKF